MKRVLMVAHFCDYGNENTNNRFNYLADLLAENGFAVELVTSSFSHRSKKQRDDNEPSQAKYDVKLIYEPSYSKNVSVKRLFYSHRVFAHNLKKYLKSCTPPDVIYCAIPSLSCAKTVADYSKKTGVKLVIDIQDLWPEAFGMVFRIPVISSLIFAPFKLIANRIYKSADAICAVSETYVNRALSVNKKCKSGTAVFLGTELATFDKNAKENEPVITKEKDEILLAYCGTLGSSYDLTCVLDAMRILNDSRVKLVVMGDGPYKNAFEDYARKTDANVLFTGRLSYGSMVSTLCACDIAVNPITHLAAQSIINKHADYAASGLPVVSTQENEEYRKLVEDYKMGFNCRNGDAEDLAEKIKILIDDADLRKRMGKNARRCAEERFDRKRTYFEISDVLTKQFCN